MWIVARYLPVTPFSLKPSSATSSGGMTLLVPTPYAIKMALLDAAIRMYGLAEGERLFPSLRDCTIALAPPDDLVVMKGFSKIRRPAGSKESKKSDETQEAFKQRMQEKLEEKMERGQYPYYSTISFREYVTYRDAFRLALSAPDGASLPDELPTLLRGINYFGKRGGFVQLAASPYQTKTLPDTRFITLTSADLVAFHQAGTLQMLDDCGQTLTFQRANIYNAERITLGKERILRHIVLPYRLQSSSRGYSWYRFIGEKG